jgi:hypothetical protein
MIAMAAKYCCQEIDDNITLCFKDHLHHAAIPDTKVGLSPKNLSHLMYKVG